MKYGKDDYVVVEVEGKTHFGLAYAKGKLLKEDGMETHDQQTIEFKSSEMLANLGKTPKIGGKVYGQTIIIYLDDLAVGWPIKVDIFREIDDREKRCLIKAFKKAKEILEKHDAFGFASCLSKIQVKPNVSKMQGAYHSKTGQEGFEDILLLTPTDLTNVDELVYYILHESSHGVWFRQLPRDYRARWSSSFNKRNDINRYGETELQELADIVVEISKTGVRFKDMMKELKSENPDEHDAFKEVIAYVKKVHHIDTEEFESLALNKPDKFKELWPVVTDNPMFKVDVTEYAMKNVKEFFAESFSYFLLGRKLPNDVVKGCKATVKSLIKTYE